MSADVETPTSEVGGGGGGGGMCAWEGRGIRMNVCK